MIAVITIVSFSLALKAIYSDKDAAFYLPQNRFWELLIGSILAYLTIYQKNIFSNFRDRFDLFLRKKNLSKKETDGRILHDASSILGISLIALGTLIIDYTKNFPGFLALLPTLGAFFIIAAGPQALLNRTILQNRVLVWIGLISFPLYLWHWPLLFFVKTIGNDKPSLMRGFAVLIALIIAWITYQFIEKPIRHGKHSNAKTIALMASMLVMAFVGYNCYEKDGLTFRMPAQNHYLRYFSNATPEMEYYVSQGIYEKYRDDCNFYDMAKFKMQQATAAPRATLDRSCFQRDTKYDKAVFLWGDSHAQHLHYGLKNYLPTNWQILQVATSACPPTLDVKGPSTTDSCQQSNWFALQALKKAKPDVVIVAQDLFKNIDTFNAITLHLKKLGVKKVIFTGPTVHWMQDLPKIVVRRLWGNIPQRTFKGIERNTSAQNIRLQANFLQSAAAKNGAVLINIIDFFCNQDGCLVYLGNDNKAGVTSSDRGHLTPIASNYLAENLLAKVVVEDDKKF